MRIVSYIGNKITAKPKTTCLIAGIATAFAMPPFHLFPLFIITFGVLLTALNKADNYKKSFLYGFLFHLGFHVAGLYWVANALLVHGWKFAWAYPLAVLGLPAFFALYGGFAGMGYRALRKSAFPGWNIFLFAVLWTMAEYARGIVFGGFPWNLVGYTWATTPLLPVLQAVSLIGIYKLGFLTALWAVSADIFTSGRKITFTVLTAVFVITAAWGGYRMHTNPTVLNGQTVRPVQANIPQKDKWDVDQVVRNFKRHVEMSQTIADKKPDIIIWPETSVPFMIKRDPYFKKYLADMLPGNAVLLAGVLDMEQNEGEDKPRVYNRMTVWNGKGEDLYHFDKSHLVPFGEYMPLGKYLPVNPVASGGLEFTAGNGVETAAINNPAIPPFSTLICYEVIFPGKAAPRGDKRPEWILNVTNDGWYGYSTGPFQHLAITRTRAVEEGLPLVRSAGTGISAVIDPVGRIVGEIGLQKSGILDVKLPQKISPTVYATIGE